MIWGEAFVDMFLRVGLRSLLAPGNLPDLAKAHRVVYTIYTTAEDARLIEAHPGFSRLREQVNVQFSLFTKLEIDSGHYGSHNILWDRGVDLARRNGEVLFLIIPDLLYASGALLHWAAKFEEGYRAIYTPGPQVVLETIVPELEKCFPSAGDEIVIDTDEVPQLMLQHLHPLHCGVMRDTPYRVSFPEYDIRAVKNCGIVLRELTAQPFCIDPNYFARFVSFSPVEDLDKVAVEPCMTLSVEPLFKHAKWSYRPWRLNEPRISQLGNFFDLFSPKGCFRDSATAHRICLVDDDIWKRESARAVAGGRFFRLSLLITRQIYRLAVSLEAENLRGAAGTLVGALYAARLRRQVNLRGDEILLIPDDDAIAAASNLLGDLFAPGREHDLVSFILDHALPRSCQPIEDAPTTCRGLPFEPLTDQFNIVSGPIRIDGFTVYVIDSVLWRERPAVETKQVGRPVDSERESDVAAPAEPAVIAASQPVVESQPIAGPGTGYVAPPLNSAVLRVLLTHALPNWAQASRRNWTYYVALHVPGSEFVLRAGSYVRVAGNAKRPVRMVLRLGDGIYRRASRVVFGSESRHYGRRGRSNASAAALAGICTPSVAAR